MADLKTGTTIAGSLIWSKANLDLIPTGDQLFFKQSLIYSENDKPSKADVGLPAVENFGVSSQAESVAGVVNDKYLTPLRNQQHFEGKTSTLTRTILGRTSASNIRGDLELGSIATEAASNYTPVARTLTAGNGLDGGGNLTTNRSFILGTPSTIGSGSGNTVGASTHSHAISLNAADIPSIDASKITSGTLSTDRIPNLAASKITSGILSTDRLPSAALIGDTTYTAGTGLTLTGTEFSLSGDSFNSSGTYSSLRAQATTAADVGAVPTGRTISTGTGLTGGGNLTTNRTFAVDSSVVRTSGDQTISGSLTVQKGGGKVFTVGSTESPEIAFDTGGTSITTSYRVYSWGSSKTLSLESMGDVNVVLDYNNNQTNKAFRVRHNGEGNTGATLFSVADSGFVTANGPLQVTSANSNGVLRLARGSGNPTIVPHGSETWMIVEGNGNLGLNYYASGNVVIANGGGNVAIGKTSASHKLDVNGTIKGNTVRGSDPILKDVQEEVYLTLEEINSLQSVLFKWKYGGDKGKLAYGILADEVEKIAPYLITWSEAEYEETADSEEVGEIALPRHRSVDYDGLSVLIGVSLAKYLKEQKV